MASQCLSLPQSVTVDSAGNVYVGDTGNTRIGKITQPTPVITWADPAPITYGTALSPVQLNASANVPGAFA